MLEIIPEGVLFFNVADQKFTYANKEAYIIFNSSSEINEKDLKSLIS